MKIRLIAPRWQQGLWGMRIYRVPPLGLLRLACATPPDTEVEVVDENIQDLTFEPVDVVGISVLTSTACRAYVIADAYRRLGSKVILGGIHPSVCPQEAIAHADSVVIGEADSAWPRILQDVQNGRLQQFYNVGHAVDLRELPICGRTEIHESDYFSINVVQTTRGCPYDCEFCSVTAFNGRKIRHRSLDSVIKEIRVKQESSRGIGRNSVLFADDNIVGDPAYAAELFKRLKPLRVDWVSQCSIRIAQNEGLLRLAAESGCRGLFIGLESLSQEALKEANKASIYRATEYSHLIRRVHAHGIVVQTGFIFGFDVDGKDVFDKTVDFCDKNRVQVAQFCPLTPFPGTRLCERLAREGRILTRDWNLYDAFHVVFRPMQMSPKELAEGVQRAYRDFYSLRSIPRRLLPMLPALGRYALLVLAINLDFERFAISLDPCYLSSIGASGTAQSVMASQ